MTVQTNAREPIGIKERTKVLAAGLLVAGVMATGLMAAAPAHAANTFTVNSTGDETDANTLDGVCRTASGVCTLRAAIVQANNFTPGADTINFSIPGSGLRTISPTNDLPRIEETVTIDGYTQPGATPNALAKGNDAKPLIELDGSKLPSNPSFTHRGLEIRFASNNVVRGLVINNFPDEAVFISGSTESGSQISIGNRIEGNFIGTDPSGTAAEPNGANDDNGGSVDLIDSGGVTITFGSSSNTVGGTSPAARNVISGNSGNGVNLSSTAGNRVLGNYIGTNKDGTGDLGNRRSGVEVGGLDTNVPGAANTNTIGGATAGAGNLISGNDGNGLGVFNSKDNKVLGNFVGTDRDGTGALGNSGGGVSILDAANNAVGDGSAGAGNTIAFNGQDGVIVNFSSQNTNKANANRILSNSIFLNAGLSIDHGNNGVSLNDPGDTDEGPNGFQNFPVLTSAKTNSTATTITGKLNSNPNKTYNVQFFSNPSGNEGKKFVGQKSVTTDGSGNVPFTFKPASKVAKGQTVTATATDPAGNTSEFSAPKTVGLASSSDLSPETLKVRGPSGLTKSPTAHFKFASPDKEATFECNLDGGAYYECSSPENIHGLSEGRHSFLVRATDEEGNADPSPAAWAWTVDRKAASS